jgi:hypothetical protein
MKSARCMDRLSVLLPAVGVWGRTDPTPQLPSARIDGIVTSAWPGSW